MTVLELSNVTRRFAGEPPIRALDGVSLRIDRSEMLAIVGPSGSGKSTLLNIMGTLDRATSGTVRLEGVDTAQLSDRQLSGLRSARLGFVFQGFHLLESVSAVDNVATGLLYQGIPTAERRARAQLALELVGLGDRLKTRPTKLSGGQRQRIAVARAIVAEPALVLADEPTGNLDSSTGQELLALFRRLNARGATIAIITHDNELANELPRQVRVRDGLIESDTTCSPEESSP